ncbi:MAG: hydrogenase maturation nickel metallochaperone HypA [Clostridium sp.]|uniref:hydrogenase maturation nickel metallochaperone HypA/HybF n=1 Tax=Clostridium sp. TaxID=1506 RepID=UPI003D6CA105
MHEYSIACEIIRIAECNARDNGALKVLKIGLVIGDYSGFIGESIQMYFDEISVGSLCEGAIISMKHIHPRLKCRECHKFFETRSFSFICSYCGGIGQPTDIGKEFYVEYIEV